MSEENRVAAAMDRAGMDPGIYRKYRVERVDGSSTFGGKHEHCTYFVLDWKHDRFAVPAARAYATACEADYPALAQDLRNMASEAEAMWARLDPRHDVITGARDVE
jgi:hypothetical protein